MNKIKFIAEVGVNHLGFENKAEIYCKSLASSHVDAVTFQIREKAFYDQSESWKSQLSDKCYINCKEILNKYNKDFGIALGDIQTAKICSNLRPDFWKVLSWGIKDISLIEFLIETGKPVYISTGISGMEEITSISKKYKKNISFIHTQLSSEIEDVNLLAIKTMRENTGCDISFGLHCSNFDVLNLAIVYNPEALFFYVKEDLDFEYPDNAWAIPISNIDDIILNIDCLIRSLGDGKKDPFIAKTLNDEDKPSILEE